MKKVSVFLGIVLLLFAACKTTTPMPGVSPVVNSPPATPILGATIPPFEPTPIPEPTSGKGSIIGRFIDYETGAPAGTTIPVFLGEFNALSDGETNLITFSPSSAPSVLIDEHGYFAFLDVDPGFYPFLLWLPNSSSVLTHPDTEQAVVATVTAGKITDLGEVAVDLPDTP